MSAIRHLSIVIVSSLGFLALGGCGEEPTVTSYDIPKEYGEAALIWKTPDGWVEESAAPGPNATSFLIQGKDGLVGKVAAMPFGAEVTMVDVANMFGRELGLAAFSEETLAEWIEKKKLGGSEFEIARLGEPDENSTGPQRSATLALLPGERETWLLMMIADASLADQQRVNFEEFLGSLTVLASKEEPKQDALDSFLHPPVTVGSPPPFTAPEAPNPEWKVPEGWEEKPASGPRAATFLVKGENKAELDVSVTSFPGSMGGPLANLNRWRRQLGLDAIAEDQLSAHATEREVDGRSAYLVNLKNGDRGMLAVMILDEERSWFVKAMGDAALAKSQKANFEAFLDSIRFAAP
ncbi:MAG: hypothetical protein VCA36_08425 [Opitutales bacterium]